MHHVLLKFTISFPSQRMHLVYIFICICTLHDNYAEYSYNNTAYQFHTTTYFVKVKKKKRREHRVRRLIFYPATDSTSFLVVCIKICTTIREIRAFQCGWIIATRRRIITQPLSVQRPTTQIFNLVTLYKCIRICSYVQFPFFKGNYTRKRMRRLCWWLLQLKHRILRDVKFSFTNCLEGEGENHTSNFHRIHTNNSLRV